MHGRFCTLLSFYFFLLRFASTFLVVLTVKGLVKSNIQMTVVIVRFRSRYLISFYGTYSRTSPSPCGDSTIFAMLSFSPAVRFLVAFSYESRDITTNRNHNGPVFDPSIFIHTLEPGRVPLASYFFFFSLYTVIRLGREDLS